MSVYIKGMEMPTDCAMMLKIFPDGRVGIPIHLNWCGTMVVNDAEAVPVPSHGRLIDADALEDNATTYYAIPALANAMDFEPDLVLRLREIDNAPTIIPEEDEGHA